MRQNHVLRKASLRGERGAALVIAILVLAILTVIGIALMLITSTESRIAANEWSVNRAFYASDAGVRWATGQMLDPRPFMTRPEFDPKFGGSDFGIVSFGLPGHIHKAGEFFTGGTDSDITVSVQKPGALGRRLYRGGRVNEGDRKSQYMYSYELRSTGGTTDPMLAYSKALVADVEVGPLPAQIPF
ncbi:MAG: pilus assembly PilX family protein [Thermoanaerobaculia bacterium]